MEVDCVDLQLYIRRFANAWSTFRPFVSEAGARISSHLDLGFELGLVREGLCVWGLFIYESGPFLIAYCSIAVQFSAISLPQIPSSDLRLVFYRHHSLY